MSEEKIDELEKKGLYELAEIERQKDKDDRTEEHLKEIQNYDWVKQNEEEFKEKNTKEIIKAELSEIYIEIINILKKFCDLKEEVYPIIALWIIGTYVHDEFETFPYLFFNAMKGSGKTRLLRLISVLSKNGDMLGSISEAVLFRTAKGTTMCIDEFENIATQEKQTLRELLNSAYKKGQKIKRMKKNKENYVVEEFEIYTSICMANIWGMDEVLGDRCITIILEKSNRPEITKLIENYTKDAKILSVKSRLEAIQCSLCSVVMEKPLENGWNNYIIDKYIYTLHTLHTQITQITQTTPEDIIFFKKMDEAGIEGRHFELAFPLLIISRFLENFDEILEIIKNIVIEKKIEDLTESKDIQIYEFASLRDPLNFISITEFTNKFRDYIGAGDKEETWINPKWIGRVLKKLNLIKERRRKAGGIEIIINVAKAQSKMEMFK